MLYLCIKEIYQICHKVIEPRITSLQPKKLIGIQIEMNLIENKTGILWGSFMPRLKEITSRVSEDKISMQVYPETYFQEFAPQNNFTKWAAVEVEHFEQVPDGMKSFNLEGGQYAVFDYKGLSSDPSIFQYIFSQWIPNSAYVLDNRPHFEVLTEKYRNNDPNSEEEIWIPIKQK